MQIVLGVISIIIVAVFIRLMFSSVPKKTKKTIALIYVIVILIPSVALNLWQSRHQVASNYMVFETAAQAYAFLEPDVPISHVYIYGNYAIVEGWRNNTRVIYNFIKEEQGWKKTSGFAGLFNTKTHQWGQYTFISIWIPEENATFLKVRDALAQFDGSYIDYIEDDKGSLFQLDRFSGERYAFIEGCPSDYSVNVNGQAIMINLNKSLSWREWVPFIIPVFILAGIITLLFRWIKKIGHFKSKSEVSPLSRPQKGQKTYRLK